MRVYAADIEADGLLDEITKVHCFSVQELDEYMKPERDFTMTKYADMREFMGDPENILVMHNGLGYDKPALEKILKAPVKAEIIDTMYLSWYLYPKRAKHGLAFWGEEFGVPKPVIDDWEGLTLEEYIHRCEEDVKIQTLLWKQMWKHLMLLYRSPEASWKAARHLSFKAKCAALQQKSKWKLDVPEAEKLVGVFTEKHQVARDALEARMPEVPVYVKKTRPKKPFKINGDLSATGLKWDALVKEHNKDFEYDGEIKVISKMKPPNAGSSKQVKDWLFSMGWVPETFKFDRNKETGDVRKIPQVKDTDKGELCPSVEKMIAREPALDFLREMSVVKHRLSVAEGFLKNVDDNGYVVALVQGLTNTLRFKHKVCLNLPSIRKPYGKEIRGLLMARTEQTELCGSDMSSLEDRTKQHFMWAFDQEYVKEMMTPGFDPHCDMAVAAGMMTEKEATWYKNYDAEKDSHEEHNRLALVRHAGKSTNYASTYGAGAATIARAAGVSEADGEKLHAAYWARNWSVKAIADGCTVKESRGMKWLYNPVSKMWLYLKAEKDRFSTLNQSTGTYCFDRWVANMLSKRAQLTGQFHDEVICELKVGNQKAMTNLLKWAVKEVNKELKLNRDLDCDVQFGRDYSEIH